MKYGIDVSHHQQPGSLPWETFNDKATFCIVRASYGTMRDRLMLEHLKRARGAGLKVGCYHFFRPSQPMKAQLDIFLAQLDLAKIGSGDIVPVLDVEADPFPTLQHVSPAWQDPVRQILGALRDRFTNAMVYITQREFGQLGSPEWLLSFPLWVAHYTGAQAPATPAKRPWTIWQHRVAPYVAFGPGGYDKDRPELDQNRAVDLPLIGAVKHELIPQPPDTNEDDAGLEEAILAHNQALLDDFVTSEYERLREERPRGTAAIREYEEAASADTDPSELAPESHS
jgi:lysozyme